MTATIRVDPDVEERILRLYKRHSKISTVAAVTGLSRRTISKYLHGALPAGMVRIGKPPISDEEWERRKRIALRSAISWKDYAQKAGLTTTHPVNDRMHGVVLGCLKCHSRPREHPSGRLCRVCARQGRKER